MSLFKTNAPGMNPDGSIRKSELAPLAEQVETPDALLAKLQKIKELEKEIEMREKLPFLLGWKFYRWAREFFESTNKINLLCAANQISKSSTQIRKAIHWATAQELWPELWLNKPTQFWYLYPSQDVVNAEFETKWVQFLPRNGMEKDPYYGWSVIKKQGDVRGIKFNSGVILFFKTYKQDADVLQTGTVDALFADEELPIHLFDELMFRLSASDGYFHMVFTATLGQDEWRRAMEPTDSEVQQGKEFLPQALKMTVSLYDAMEYEDGSKSQWTLKRIKEREARCSTHAEILKRIHGKFIVLAGRKYESFDLKRHFKPRHQIPRDWLIYGAADNGSGGEKGHPGALCYVAVSPDFRKGRVFLGWRGDGIVTTPADIIQKHIDMKKENKFSCTRQFYDWASKDFYNIGVQMGEPFEKAEKGHDIGEDVINTLFKNDMLFIYEDDELQKLGAELATLLRTTRKNEAKDDFADAFRYAVTKVPWDWSVIIGQAPHGWVEPEKEMTDIQRQVEERRKAFDDYENEEAQRIDDEFSEWNEQYGD